MEYQSKKLFRETTRELRHSITKPGDDSKFLYSKNLELLNDICNLIYIENYNSPEIRSLRKTPEENEAEKKCIKPIYTNDFNFALLIIFINYFLNKII